VILAALVVLMGILFFLQIRNGIAFGFIRIAGQRTPFSRHEEPFFF